MLSYQHLIFSVKQNTPQTEPSKLINNLKTVSSRYLWEEFVDEVNQVYWKDVLWTSGYFIASCGGVTVDQLRKYIEEQDRLIEDCTLIGCINRLPLSDPLPPIPYPLFRVPNYHHRRRRGGFLCCDYLRAN
jgi:hypothetical protein